MKLSEEEFRFLMEIDKNDPEYIAFKKECSEKKESFYQELSKKHNLDIDYVRTELEKGPFFDSPIWKIIS